MNIRRFIKDNWTVLLFVIPVLMMIGEEAQGTMIAAFVILAVAILFDIATTEAAKEVILSKATAMDNVLRNFVADRLRDTEEKLDVISEGTVRAIKDISNKIETMANKVDKDGEKDEQAT